MFGDITTLDASDESDGWYTSRDIMEKVWQVLGRVDCDPATCEAAQSVVRASVWYTKAQDGLQQPWYGNVFLNPPYSQTDRWVKKLLEERKAGHTIAAIVLTNAYTDTNWWHNLAAVSLVLFTRNRLTFWHPAKQAPRNRMGSCVFYLGSNDDCFRSVFRDMGTIR